MDDIKNKLIEIAGKNVLGCDLKEIKALVKCVDYLVTQIRIVDESDNKERSSAVLENIPKILSGS